MMGVGFGFTVMVNVVVVAQRPAVGVNVYIVVVVLFNAGAHVPVMPFKEVVGNAVNVAPEQIAATGLNVGVTFGFTVMVNVVVVAHWPAVGVNVYVVVVVLFKAGAHVPVIPFKEVVGNAVNAAPEHIAATGVNVGVTFGFTVMVNVVVVAH
jgi:phage terminase large subunit